MTKEKKVIENLEEIIATINNRESGAINWKEIELIAGCAKRTIQRRISEGGFKLDKSTQTYYYDSENVLNEIAVTLEEEEEEDNENEFFSDIEKNDFNNEIDDIFESIGQKEKFIPVMTHLRNDINEALKKFAKEKPKGAKQELINGLLEVALKRKGYL